ncbi:MAG: UDP-2,3-diacylglucosamine diphosphatase LpxI [Proteobacteria bacterium]|nr:UDP-2,3-diacylglucosamine diphosphatase LpxI [Pseudomonadota bacterium]
MPARHRLGLIAGGGALPVELASWRKSAGDPAFVIRLKGFADAALQGFEGADVGIAELGRCFDALSRAGCDRVCMAGQVNRPDFAALKPDLRGLKALPGAIAAARQGDDALLRYLLGQFEAEGFAVVGAHEVARELLLEEGPAGALAPDAVAQADMVRGFEVADALGALDIGQAVVVANGLVLAVEAQEGTDAMLTRCASLPTALLGEPGRRLGVLVKRPKPIQERRMDLPVIGVETVERAAAAGLAGIAGEGGGLLVLSKPRVVEAADRMGLFLFGARA